ncbi:hypothetical protein BDZ94DRAFT_1314751 [Collybia nuda]|uniref:DRBM domain-containing protein n=1 Tax=Collybia nuda TaxID=64659 RepID=A0A9P5XU92_9AGAR|nr:hypothetical protein BDZ94DRAFT_1314751 [Collybia nuda]
MNLNNFASQHRLSVTYTFDGPYGTQHDCVWFSTVYVGGKIYGRCQGRSMDQAKEAAAACALEILLGPPAPPPLEQQYS